MIRFGIKSGNLDGALNRRGLLKVFRTYHPYIQDQCGWCCNAVICTSLKLLALECHYSPGPFPHVTAVNISGTLQKETPLFTLNLTHFVSGKQLMGAGGRLPGFPFVWKHCECQVLGSEGHV